MKALVKYAAGIEKVELRDTPVPEPGKGEVRIKVMAAGICGTDIHIYFDDSRATNPPVILGHELSGIVDKVGSLVSRELEGRRVIAESCYYTCGRCEYCVTGRENLCDQRLAIGSTKDGAMAEYVIVPEENIHFIPDEVDFLTGALTEPLACCVQAVYSHNDISPFHEVLVVGPGTIGLLCSVVLKHKGAKVTIVGTTEDQERLEIAKRIGVDHAIMLGSEGDKNKVLESFKRGGADAVFECSGSESGINLGLSLIRKGATYTQVGLSGKPVSLPIDYITYNEIKVRGTSAQKKDVWERSIKLLVDKHHLIEELHPKYLPISQWKYGFESFHDKKALKYVIDPQRSE